MPQGCLEAGAVLGLQSQQVPPLLGVGEVVELVLDEQEILTQGDWLVRQPLLQMIPFPQVQVREPGSGELDDEVLGAVNTEHGSPSIRPLERELFEDRTTVLVGFLCPVEPARQLA